MDYIVASHGCLGGDLVSACGMGMRNCTVVAPIVWKMY